MEERIKKSSFHNKWKVPVAYFVIDKSVSGRQIKNIISLVVSALIKIGLKIRGVICDQGSTHRKAARLLNVTTDKPHFQCDGEKVFFIYDFPHIIKCIRNNLSKKNKRNENIGQIKTSAGVADWNHLRDLHRLDVEAAARATKLSDKHIDPDNFTKMSVCLATQVFSHSVSAAMKTAVAMKQLPADAAQTADFLEKMNNIFDIMNSKSRFHPNPFKCAISNSQNAHLRTSLETLKEAIEWAKTWTMVNIKSNPPSFDGLVHSLTAVAMLWEDLSSENTSYLLTNRLNQDPLENEFGVSRQRGGFERNPSVKRFRENLRHRIMAVLIKPPSGTNCELDDDSLLDMSKTSSSQLPSTSDKSPDDTMKSSDDAVESGAGLSDSESEDELKEMDVCEINSENQTLEACAVRYFAGFAVKSCTDKYKCTLCKIELTRQVGDGTSERSDETLIVNKTYKTTREIDAAGETSNTGLTKPSDQTTRVARLILEVFDRHINTRIHERKILSNLILKSKQTIFKFEESWLKTETCQMHRHFFIKKILLAKLKRKLNDVSKILRQPGGKSSKSHMKLNILKNN